jgi:anaerobic glycerol-3-phosphate dehydrogenase
VKQNTRHIDTDLTIIGSGLAGVAASSFALRRNIRTAQAGNTGALAYTTGYFDLLGSLTGGSGASISDPWEGIRRLRESEPLHPLARIAEDDIRASFEEFITFLAECGITYGKPGDRNLDALTPGGSKRLIKHPSPDHRCRDRRVLADWGAVLGNHLHLLHTGFFQRDSEDICKAPGRWPWRFRSG